MISFAPGVATMDPRHCPKKHAPGSLKFMDVVFYRGERMFIEAAPLTWSHSAWVKITDKPLREQRETWPDERQSYSVHADLLELAPPVANPFTSRLPTTASVARAERVKRGERDIGDPIAVMLRDCKGLDDVYSKASEYLGAPEPELRAKYGHLNPGQQRMNLGNKMRFKWRKGN